MKSGALKAPLGARSFPAELALCAPAAWRETPSTSSAFAQENPASTRNGCRVEITYNLYAPRATDLRCCAWLQPAHTGAPHVLVRGPALGPLLVLVEALTSGNAGLALVNLLFELGNNATLYGLWILSCRIHQSNVICGDQANDVQNLERTLW